MKNKICIVLSFCSLVASSQISLEGHIKDLKSKEPLAYCAVGLKNGTKGCLANDEGVFTISSVSGTDSIIISYIGYKRKTISVSDLAKNSTIYLEHKDNTLAEVVVYGNDEYLYEAFEKCRKTLFNPKENESKVYYVLESHIADQPVELLECYYNGRFDNCKIKDLYFKNGRVGKTIFLDGRNFSSLNTSKAFMLIDLLNGAERVPIIPFQLNKKKLKKTYHLKFKSQFDDLNPVYIIEFTPVDNDGKHFEGEAWIEKKTGALKKITLNIHETTYHPFIPILKDLDEIKSVSMQITKTFNDMNGKNILHHIDFNYQLNYHHVYSSGIRPDYKDTTFEVKSKGLMYFYDYDNLFYIPYFDFNNDLSDYRKISSLTYNKFFWQVNSGLVYSDKMKKAILYFKNNGYFLNYAAGLNNKTDTHNKFTGFYENTYLAWSGKARLSLKKDGIKNDTLSKSNVTLSQRYQLKAQIFFDINPVADSLQHYSTCIFDVFNTYYNLPEELFTNCFMNIYFDLFEIERRKMEKVISKNKFTLPQLDSLYKRTVKNLDRQTADYMRQVEHGKNLKELEKWNVLVKQNLGIDNFELFEMKELK